MQVTGGRASFELYLPLVLAMSNMYNNTVSSHIRNDSLYLCPSNHTNDMTIPENTNFKVIFQLLFVFNMDTWLNDNFP